MILSAYEMGMLVSDVDFDEIILNINVLIVMNFKKKILKLSLIHLNLLKLCHMILKHFLYCVAPCAHVL